MNKLNAFQQSKIYKSINMNDHKRIVLIDVSEQKDLSKVENNQNIYFVDMNNNIIWQIKTDNMKFEDDMFVSVKKTDDGQIIAKRFSGFKYVVDIRTGHAKEVGWEK